MVANLVVWAVVMGAAWLALREVSFAFDERRTDAQVRRHIVTGD